MAYLKSLVLIFFLLFSTTIISEVPSCVRDLELQFFQRTLVQEALSLHSISQSNWNLIYTELSIRVKRVPDIVEKKARALKPNPFGPPYQPFVLQDMIESVLLEVFKETLVIFHIQNESNVAEMFQYIRKRQEDRFIRCFGDRTKLKTAEIKP